MWTLRTFSGQTFRLTDRQKDVYIKAVENGAKMINFGSFIVSSNFEYIISDEEAALEKLRQNPVLNDPDFVKLVQTGNPGVAQALDARYPLPRYQKEWDEAKKNKQYVYSLVKQ